MTEERFSELMLETLNEQEEFNPETLLIGEDGSGKPSLIGITSDRKLIVPLDEKLNSEKIKTLKKQIKNLKLKNDSEQFEPKLILTGQGGSGKTSLDSFLETSSSELTKTIQVNQKLSSIEKNNRLVKDLQEVTESVTNGKVKVLTLFDIFEMEIKNKTLLLDNINKHQQNGETDREALFNYLNEKYDFKNNTRNAKEFQEQVSIEEIKEKIFEIFCSSLDLKLSEEEIRADFERKRTDAFQAMRNVINIRDQLREEEEREKYERNYLFADLNNKKKGIEPSKALKERIKDRQNSRRRK